MVAIGRTVVVVAATIAAWGTLAGCSPWWLDEGREYKDSRTETATVNSIDLAGGDGGIIIRRGTGTGVQIHRTVWWRGDRDREPTDRLDRVDGTTLVLDTHCGRDCVISYDVTVPTAVNVTGRLDTGPIQLSDVGSVTVDNSDGGIDVRRASGDVTVRTDTGPIDLADIAGAIAARSQDGGISVRGGAQTVTAETDTGPIRLVDVTGAVKARSQDGGISLDDVGGEVSAATDTGPISGTALAGGRTVAESHDGGIRLAFTTAQDVDARTVTGPIDLRVPQVEGGYRVRTDTDTGPTSVNVPTSPAGTRSLILTSQDGGITVNSA
jgi:hypothetical protein